MNDLKNKVLQSRFLKSLLILASGSLFGSLIIAISEIARTWIFPKEAIGVFTFLLAIPLTFISVTSLRYDVAIVIEKDDSNALALVKASVILATFISIIITCGFVAFILLVHKEYVPYLYLAPFIFLVILGYGINNVLNAYNNRFKEYATISKKYVQRTAVQHIGALVLGIIFVLVLNMPSISVLVMMAPYGIGLFAGIKQQAAPLLSKIDIIKSITNKEMMDAITSHRKQALYSSPALFLNSFSFTVITFIIEDLFNATTLAFYSIANRVLGVPIGLISANVAKVYIEEASKEYNATGQFYASFKKTLLFLVAMAIPMFLLLYYCGPVFCKYILGPGWLASGKYIQILSVMFSFRLIGTAISQSLSVCNKQGWELVINLALVIASLLSGIFTKINSESIYFFLKLLSISRSLCYVGLIILVYYFAKGKGLKRKAL